MSRTSSPWATPSSPAGRRLLDAEPVTLDAIPVLTLAVTTGPGGEPSGPAPVAPSAPSPALVRPRPVVPARHHRRSARWARLGRAPAGALAVAMLALAPVGAAPAAGPTRTDGVPSGAAVALGVRLGRAEVAAVADGAAPAPPDRLGQILGARLRT